MELDKRIIKGKKPLDCFDIEIAQQFIGKKGFFGVHRSQFINLDTCPKCVNEILNKIDNYEECSFVTSGNYAYMYFLPEEWVKEPEKKYRAFTISEFIEQHEIGEVIHYRSKSGEIELREMYVGTRHSQGIKKIIVKITLGNESHTLDYLFENYEIEVDGEWQPFGVKE